MRREISKKLICVLSALVLIASGFVTAYAVDEDYDGFDDITGEPIVDNVDPVATDPIYTDPIYTDAPYTEAPYTDAPYTDAPNTEDPYTEDPQAEQSTDAQVEDNTDIYVPVERGDIEQDPSEFVPPTVSKTVSQKSYTTNYTAGIVSWICVGVGLLLMFVVALSTKISGRSSRKSI